MTQAQADQLESAITRATERGIGVVAHGHRKSDNARIFCTNSISQPDRWHIVTLVGRRLVCDCKARVICTHRAAVYMELVAEHCRRERLAAVVEMALQREADAGGVVPVRAPERLRARDADMGGASLDIMRGWGA